MHIIHHTFHGHTFHFQSTPTLPSLIGEIFSDNYHILQSGLKFGVGDIIIDLGANEGIFSIMFAKLFPQAHVISLEPVLRTYKTLLTNIALNSLPNITTLNCGVGASSSPSVMVISKEMSGGSSTLIDFIPTDHVTEVVKLISLDQLFGKLQILTCKLLKIDIEGMEHDTLLSFQSWDKVQNMVGEFHINSHLQNRGHSIDGLVNFVKSRTNLLFYESCKMSE
jgi:FkbM family methyltransferase